MSRNRARRAKDEDEECYCDFASRLFFGCDSEEHVSPCPQAPVSSQNRGAK